VHAHARRFADTDWAEIDQLYGVLERLQPSPVVTLNRAVAVAQLSGPAAALAMIEPLAGPPPGHFHFFGVQAPLLHPLPLPHQALPPRAGPARRRRRHRPPPPPGGGSTYPSPPPPPDQGHPPPLGSLPRHWRYRIHTSGRPSGPAL